MVSKLERSTSVLTFRWCVFALTVVYTVIAFDDFELAKVGWQYRYLTDWGLAMSTIAAAFMLRRSLGVSDARNDVWASSTVIVNIMVVFLYWKIYFADPSQFYIDGIRTIPLWKEYYLHLLGPILQWIDALFILGAFRPIKRIFMLTFGITVGYLSWTEIVVRPFNNDPVGSVTSGLPYRFLNNMEFSERLVFYVQNVVIAMMLVGVFWGICKVVRRITAA